LRKENIPGFWLPMAGLPHCQIRSSAASGISAEGLAFRYVADERKEDNVSESSVICIVHDSGFSLLDLPCQVIGNECSRPGHPQVFSKMNTCRIPFSRLARDQKAQLDYFIAHFTIGSQARLIDRVDKKPGSSG